MLGERIPATKAEQWGLIWSAVADAELDERVAEIAEVLKRSSPDASVRIRETINEASHNSFAEQLDLEMAHQAVLIPKNMWKVLRRFCKNARRNLMVSCDGREAAEGRALPSGWAKNS